MKKELFIFLLVSAVLFSCSDLSVNEEDALKGELPADFKWREYIEINRDVKSSQIVFDIQNKMKELKLSSDADERKDECKNLLSDTAFARDVYLNYAGCPRKGWPMNRACTGEYASYTTVTVSSNGKDTTYTCVLGSCWEGGWDEPANGCDEFTTSENRCQTHKDSLSSKINKYEKSIEMMCKLVLPKASLEGAKNYLNNYSVDSTLVGQHYFIVGRSEGRPYKYCINEESDRNEERNPSLAFFLYPGESPRPHFNFYDYGRYLFCLDTTKTDWKIYLTQEKK